MSNKTQLQTNNTTLSSLIQTLQGKAAGGSSGAVETCTVTLADQASEICYTKYVDGVFSGAAAAVSAEVVKNTVVAVFSPSGKYMNRTITGDATFIGMFDITVHMFFVTGDCTISIN